MNYFSLDWSTSRPGYAFKKDGKYIVGALTGAKGSMWEKTYQYGKQLIEIIGEYDLVNYHLVIEKPIIVRGKSRTMEIINCNGMVIGMLQDYVDGFTFISNKSWGAYHLLPSKSEDRKKEANRILFNDLGVKGHKGGDEADAYCQLKYVESLVEK